MYWDPRQTDGQTNLISFRTIYVSFLSSYRNPRKTDRRTNYFSFHPSYCNQSGMVYFTSYWNIRRTNRRTNYVSFHSLYCPLDRQIDKLDFISPLILESKQERRINYVTFHLSYWNPHKKDGQTTYYVTPHIGILVRQTDGQTTLYLTCQFESTQDRQTDKFSPLILESK